MKIEKKKAEFIPTLIILETEEEVKALKLIAGLDVTIPSALKSNITKEELVIVKELIIKFHSKL